MLYTSTRFGTFELNEASVLTFPTGLLGFPAQRRYVLLDHDTDAPFKWLQSLEDPSLAFVVIDPALFHPVYRVEYPREALEEVRAEAGDDLSLAVILTIPSDDPGRVTANLRGPLLMNARTRLCKQLVLSEDFPTRYPLFTVDSGQPRGSFQAASTEACPA